MARPGPLPRVNAAANMTPMIDVVFQLIVFFMIVARFSQPEALDLVLPSVDERISEAAESDLRAVVNIVPRGRVVEMGGAYRLGSQVFPETAEGAARLAAALAEARSRQPAVEVSVRADRTEPYARVHPAVQAATIAGIRRVHLVTLPLTKGEP